MQCDEAIRTANAFIQRRGILVGPILKVEKLLDEERRFKNGLSGEVWSVMFKIPLAHGVHRDPDVVIVEVEDASGIAKLYPTL